MTLITSVFARGNAYGPEITGIGNFSLGEQPRKGVAWATERCGIIGPVDEVFVRTNGKIGLPLGTWSKFNPHIRLSSDKEGHFDANDFCRSLVEPVAKSKEPLMVGVRACYKGDCTPEAIVYGTTVTALKDNMNTEQGGNKAQASYKPSYDREL
jgi:hypothetical protein